MKRVQSGNPGVFPLPLPSAAINPFDALFPAVFDAEETFFGRAVRCLCSFARWELRISTGRKLSESKSLVFLAWFYVPVSCMDRFSMIRADATLK